MTHKYLTYAIRYLEVTLCIYKLDLLYRNNAIATNRFSKTPFRLKQRTAYLKAPLLFCREFYFPYTL